MRKFSKVTAVIMAATMILGVVGCGDKKATENNTNNSTGATTVASTNGSETTTTSTPTRYDKESWMKTYDAITYKELVQTDISSWENEIGLLKCYDSNKYTDFDTSAHDAEYTRLKVLGEKFSYVVYGDDCDADITKWAYDSATNIRNDYNSDGTKTNVVYTKTLQVTFSDETHAAIFVGVVYNTNNNIEGKVASTEMNTTNEAIIVLNATKQSDGWFVEMYGYWGDDDGTKKMSNMFIQKAGVSAEGTLKIVGR